MAMTATLWSLAALLGTAVLAVAVHRAPSRPDWSMPSRSPRASSSCSKPAPNCWILPSVPRPARLTVELRDLPWDFIHAPVGEAIWSLAERLNHLQFLTIRRYLSLVFTALIALLLTVAPWY
jgi:hypothetical protein